MWHPTAPRESWSKILFRCAIDLPRQRRRIALWYSGSMRVALSLDGRILSRGPSRSDPLRWGARRVVVPALAAGRHVLTAEVTFFADAAGLAQMGPPAFFLITSEDPDLASQLAPSAWRCWHDRAAGPAGRHGWIGKRPHQVIGDGESFLAAQHPWSWQNDDHASDAVLVLPAAYCPWGNLKLGCRLHADPLPEMAAEPHAWARAIDGGEAMIGGEPTVIPPDSVRTIVLDAGRQVNAWPTLRWSGGAGATIDAVWSEAPWMDDHNLRKAPRDDATDRFFRGPLDAIAPDGGAMRSWTPAWFRPFRYLKLIIATRSEPLTVHGCELTVTHFPMRYSAQVALRGPTAARWHRLIDASAATLRLCAHELIVDCPHYEQCQFPGDARVQAWAHALISGDGTLSGKAIDDLAASRMSDGMLQCRWPSRSDQIISSFGLAWIGMLDDRRMLHGDRERLATHMHTARGIADWFLSRVRADGLLGLIPHAPFIDWAGFDQGNAPQDADGGSAILSAMLAETCIAMEHLERYAGVPAMAADWRRHAAALRMALKTHCFDRRCGLIADVPGGGHSVHAQTHAILAGALTPAESRHALLRALDQPGVRQPGTHYFRYHLARAMHRCGLSARIHDLMPRFAANLDAHHLDTLPESDADPRSDCHAWSVLPVIAAINTVLGLRPDPRSAGFARAILTPSPGDVTAAKGTVPTPHGPIRIAWTRHNDSLAIDLASPVPVIAAGRTYAQGRHRLRIRVRG